MDEACVCAKPVLTLRALEDLPRISATMSRGELSYSKARALTRVACPQTEDYFLSIALHGTAAHVEKLVRHYRRGRGGGKVLREAQQHAARKGTYFFDHDGSLVLQARLPAEIGALVVKALDTALNDPATNDSPVNATAQGDERPSWGKRRADALGRIAESFLQRGSESLSSGDRHQIIVHVDADTLR